MATEMKQIYFKPGDKLEMGIGAGLWPAVRFGLPTMFWGMKIAIIVIVMAYILTILYTFIAGSIRRTLGLLHGAAFGVISGLFFMGFLIGTQQISPVGQSNVAMILAWTVLFMIMGTMIVFDFLSWSPLHTQYKFHKLMKKLFPKTISPVNLNPVVIEKQCIGVAICVDVCPVQTLKMNEHKIPVVDSDVCVSCFACAQQCPVDAIPMITESLGINTDIGALTHLNELKKTTNSN